MGVLANTMSTTMALKPSTSPAEQAAVDVRRIEGSSPSQGIVANDDAFSTFAERHRLVDPRSPDAARVVAWFSSIGDKLLAADATTLKTKVSYHLSDSTEVSAYVSTIGGEARIVITKGLLESVIKNEDQLATIIGHELMHVHFSERLDDGGKRIKNTKLEEYIADVASVAKWMIKAGYAPHQAVAVFDGLRENSELHKERSSRLLMPWIAYNDVHGLLENRSQAINALIAKEIKEKGEVPATITHTTGAIKAAVRSSHHVTHVQKLKADPGYAQASGEDKLKQLLVEVRAVTRDTAGRMEELDSEIGTVLRDIPITAATVEEVYAATKENKGRNKSELLNVLFRIAKQNGKELAPPQELREIAKEIRALVSATSDRQIAESSKRIALFAREWEGIDPGVRSAISYSFSQPREGVDVPWDRHMQVARIMAERGNTEVLEALWSIGVLDLTLLNFAPDELLARFAKVPELTTVQGGRDMVLSPSGEWRRAGLVASDASTATGETALRASYREFVDAEKAARAHKRRVESDSPEDARLRFRTLEEVPAEFCATNVERVVSAFADQLAHPDKLDFHAPSNLARVVQSELRARGEMDHPSEAEEDSSNDDSPEVVNDYSGPVTQLHVAEDLGEHYRITRILTEKFEEMLALEDPRLRRQAVEGIRGFFLNMDGPCYATLIGFHPEDAISSKTHCRHPLVSYAARCTALTAEERVDFLRGLEHRLPPETWQKAFFSGYTFADDREKLRHLQSVSIHQDSARESGAQLIVSLSDTMRPGKQSFI